MSQPYFMKNLPAPIRAVIRPMLYLSLALHASLLFAPLSREKEVKPPEKENPVKITQITAPKPKTPPKPKPKPPRPQVQRSTPPVQRRAATPPPVRETRQPESKPTKEEPTPDDKNPFEKFPHHPASQAGCYDLEGCRQVDGQKIDAVVAHFKTALPKEKFEISPDADEAERKVFQVSKGTESQYLTLFQDGVNTVYVLGPAPIGSLNDLKSALEVPSGLYELLADDILFPPLDPDDPAQTNNARWNYFPEPERFIQNLDAVKNTDSIPEYFEGIDGTPKVSRGEEPEFFYQTSFEQPLGEMFDKVTLVGEYGGPGSKLYELQKGKKKFYLNLVPVPQEIFGQPGTIVVIWLKDPR